MHSVSTTLGRMACIFVVLSVFCDPAVLLRAQSSLQIASPADGTVVHPGDTVTVTVSNSGVTFARVAIMGEDPLPSQVLTAPPYQFSIPIPSTIEPGSYMLSAFGALASGGDAESDPISIDVERADRPSSISIEPSSLSLWVGARTSLRVIGAYLDGSTVDLTKSTQTTYVSQSPNIVTVSADGLVTAVASGSTQIMIDGNFAVLVTVEAPVTVVPSDATIAASQTRQFTARVTNASNPGVIWSISPNGVGSIDATGLYTAPASVPNAAIHCHGGKCRK